MSRSSENDYILPASNGRVFMENVKIERGRCCWRSECGRYVPWSSLISLLITWSGLFLFCTKTYYGLQDMEKIAGGFFKASVYYIQLIRDAILILGVAMAALTASMVLVGFFATVYMEGNYRTGHGCYCICGCLGNRIFFASLWILEYFFYATFLAILSALVLATSAYFCFLPICLPQAGAPDMYCFNFTVVASMMGADTSMVSLILTGRVIDKFCKLTKAIVPWYWGAYAGCITVLLGLHLFNGCLTANFVNMKHGAHYRKIRRRTRKIIEWTRDWRIKSIQLDGSIRINDLNSSMSTISDTISTAKPARRYRYSSETNQSDLSRYLDPDMEIGRARKPTPIEEDPLEPKLRPDPNQSNAYRPRTSSTGSIILHYRHPNAMDQSIASSSHPDAGHFQ